MNTIYYLYPIRNKVSFQFISKQHIRHLKESLQNNVKILEVDVDTFDPTAWGFNRKLIVHPLFYPFFEGVSKEANVKISKLNQCLNKGFRIISFDTADSDRISEKAVDLANKVEAVVVPSNFAKEVYEKSGVYKPIHVVPHGIPDEFMTNNRKVTHPDLAKLKDMKEKNDFTFVLFHIFHCYDEETRILTKEGFKKWNEITKDDEIATFNLKTGELEYQKPEEIFIYEYKGKMIHFKGQHYDLLVTPNHRMVVRRARNYIAPQNRNKVRDWKIKEAFELLINKSWVKYEVPRVVKWNGKQIEFLDVSDYTVKHPPIELLKELYEVGLTTSEIADLLGVSQTYVYNRLRMANVKIRNKGRQIIAKPSKDIVETILRKYNIDTKWFKDKVYRGASRVYEHQKLPIKPFLRFLGWFISEGQARHNKHNNTYWVIIWNNNEEYLKEIAETMRELGYHPIVDYNKKCVIVTSIQLYEIIKGLGLPVYPEVKGKKAHLKFVPDFIKELSPELIKEFLMTLWKGDGTFYKTKNGKLIPLKYSTTSKKLAEDIAELCLKCGYAVSINVDDSAKRLANAKHPLYNVIVSVRYANPSMNNKPEVIDYEGIVWCVKVPNGAVIVERNGKIVVSGNSGFRKGADLFAKAMSIVQKENPNAIILAKRLEGLDPYLPLLRQLRCIEIGSYLELDAYRQLYDLSDITVLASRGGGWELNALESLARGIPTIVPKAGCFLDYIEYTIPVRVTKNRPVVLPDNPIHVGRGWEIDVEELAKTILKVADNLSKYKRIARKNMKKIWKEYSWRRIVDKIVKILSEYDFIKV